MKAASLYLLAVLGSSTARANTSPTSILPHGMLPSALSGDSERIHNAVLLEDSTEEEQTCKDRLVHLRSLMAAGKLKEAVDVSLALGAHHRASKKHADCHADQPHVGEGSIVTRVATPDDREQHASSPVVDSFIKLHKDEETGAVENFLRIAHTSRASVRKSMARVPVVGFALDGTFVLAEAPLRCTAATGSSSSALSCSGGADLHEHLVGDEKAAAALLLLSNELTAAGKRRRGGNKKKGSESRRLMPEWTDMGKPLIPDVSIVTAELASRKVNKADLAGGSITRAASLGDKDSSYTIGTKSTLVIPLVPSDGVATDDQTGYASPLGYDYGLVKSQHSSNIRSYLQECMTQNSDFYKDNSWGAMDLSITITPVMQVSYTGATCGDHPSIQYWYSSPVLTSFDMMGYAAAFDAGFDQTQYDLNVLFMPKCWGQSFAGIGWVGIEGALQNSQLLDYDASVAHELGHNLGANHASYMTTGTRGADAFGKYSDLEARPDWIEYGNPHSAMGQGDFMDFRADFVIEGKAVFDWVSDAEMSEVVPYDENGFPQCSPCGPYYLSPTDATTKPAGATMGISIATATPNRYYFIEHRTESTSGNAALITWAGVLENNGGTGVWENSVLADCTPDTNSWLDAGCTPGMSIQLSAGTGQDDAQQITVSVLQVESNGTLAVEVTSSAPTTSPTSSPAPTKSFAPTPQPTTQYPCPTMILAGTFSHGAMGDFTVAGEDTNGNVYFTNGLYYMYFYSSSSWFISKTLGSDSIYGKTTGWTSEWPGSTGWMFWTGAWVTPDVTLTCDSTPMLPVPSPTKLPTPSLPVPSPTKLPVPSPTKLPTPSLPVPSPTKLPVPSPTKLPTPSLPVPSPTKLPVPSPTKLPTLSLPVPSPTKSPTQDGGGGGGHCFSGDDKLLVQNAATHTVVSTALVDVKVGDQVLTVDHHQKKQFATVKELPHSPSVGDFIKIQLAPSTVVEEAPAPTEENPKKGEVSAMKTAMRTTPSPPFLSLRTTEHHTFPQCKSTKAHPSHHLRKHQSMDAVIQAHEIKEGDCLLTLDGESTVKSVERRLATPKDVTYTVQLEGTHDLLVVGGVVTHAKPSAHQKLTANDLIEFGNKKVSALSGSQKSALSSNGGRIRKKSHGT